MKQFRGMFVTKSEYLQWPLVTNSSAPLIDAIFVGGPKTLSDKQGIWQSSIQRQRVDGAVQFGLSGIAGDQATQPYHGGRDAALCVHLSDHYAFWRKQYGLTLQPGSVGENLTLGAIQEEEIYAGDIVRLGSAIVQVSGPRVPCANLARHVGRPDWVKLTVQENRTGFYLRVLRAGSIVPGDVWQVQERLNEDAAIPSINQCMYLSFDPAYAERMLQMRALGEWWKQQAAEKLTLRDRHWTGSIQHGSA